MQPAASALRRHALQAALREYVAGCDTLEVLELAERARRGVRTGHQWVDVFSGNYAARHRRRQTLEQTLADIEAAAHIWECARRDGCPAGPVAFVGRSTLLDLASLRRYVTRAIERGILAASRPHLAYRYARRFPNPGCKASSAADQDALIDRVDALTEAFSHATEPSRHAVMRRAHALMGPVLRDRSALARLVALLPRSDTAARSALSMAVCLLDEWPRAARAAISNHTDLEAIAGSGSGTSSVAPVVRE